MIETKVCPTCGTEGTSAMRFCPKCGTEMKDKTLRQISKDSFFRGLYGKEERTDQARVVDGPQPLPDKTKVMTKGYYLGLGMLILSCVNEDLFFWGLLVLLVVYCIQTFIADEGKRRLRRMKFRLNTEIDNTTLFMEMQPVFSSVYNMIVDRREDGVMVLKNHDRIYDVLLQKDGTFVIWWRKTLVRAILSRSGCRPYRILLADMGIIAYEIQAHFGVIEKVETAHRYDSNESSGKSLKSDENYDSTEAGPPASQKQSSWIAYGSAVLMILSVFLPAVKVSFLGVTTSQSYFDGGDGIFFLVIAAIVLVLTYMNKQKGVLVMGIIACVLMAVEIVDLSEFIKQQEYGQMIERGIGHYGLILSSVGLLMSHFIKK